MHRYCPFKYTTGSVADGLAVLMHIAHAVLYHNHFKKSPEDTSILIFTNILNIPGWAANLGLLKDSFTSVTFPSYVYLKSYALVPVVEPCKHYVRNR